MRTEKSRSASDEDRVLSRHITEPSNVPLVWDMASINGETRFDTAPNLRYYRN